MEDIVKIINMFDFSLWCINNSIKFDKPDFKLGVEVSNFLSSDWSFDEKERILTVYHYGKRKTDYNILAVGNSDELTLMIVNMDNHEVWIMLSPHKEK